MASIIWSLTNGGDPITDTVNLGSLSNGQATTAKELFIRHDDASSITDVGFFIRQFSGTYSGSVNGNTDILEVIAWGDASTEAAFGGFQINQKRDQPSNTFDSSAWPTYDSKAPFSGKGNTFRTGTGDSENNVITLLSSTGATADGELQAGSSPNVSFQVRIYVPSEEDTIGIRQFEQVCVFNSTS